jgi:hypothetical protein
VWGPFTNGQHTYNGSDSKHNTQSGKHRFHFIGQNGLHRNDYVVKVSREKINYMLHIRNKLWKKATQFPLY